MQIYKSFIESLQIYLNTLFTDIKSQCPICDIELKQTIHVSKQYGSVIVANVTMIIILEVMIIITTHTYKPKHQICLCLLLCVFKVISHNNDY